LDSTRELKVMAMLRRFLKDGRGQLVFNEDGHVPGPRTLALEEVADMAASEAMNEVEELAPDASGYVTVLVAEGGESAISRLEMGEQIAPDPGDSRPEPIMALRRLSPVQKRMLVELHEKVISGCTNAFPNESQGNMTGQQIGDALIAYGVAAIADPAAIFGPDPMADWWHFGRRIDAD
jgi:hypothetical protein